MPAPEAHVLKAQLEVMAGQIGMLRGLVELAGADWRLDRLASECEWLLFEVSVPASELVKQGFTVADALVQMDLETKRLRRLLGLKTSL